MKIVRAIRQDDLDGLMNLALQTGAGMSTLKPNKKLLGDRIVIACASFAEQIPPEQRDYVFVLEDTDIGSIVGVSAIKSRVGLDEPFYNYRIGTQVHSNKELHIYSRMDTLYLSNDLTGHSELCSLFLHPGYRQGISGQLLSRARFLFIAQFPYLFSEKLMAELRGFQEADGSSPFWDSLGRLFFKMDFSRADDLCSEGKKSFLAELMPHHPLYVVYLTKEAQDAIGRVHVDTEPARSLLEYEGFHFEGFVDIFDAGPVLQARISELRTLRVSELMNVIDATSSSPGSNPMLVANTNLHEFRVIVSDVEPKRGQLSLTIEQQQFLQCSENSQVRVMPLKT